MKMHNKGRFKHISMNAVNEKINLLLNKEKIKNGIKDFLEKMKQEGREYREMEQIILDFVKTGKVSREDSKKVYEQLLDTLKIGGSAGVWLIPGGSVLLIILVKLAEKWGINILPSAFSKKNEKKEMKINK